MGLGNRLDPWTWELDVDNFGNLCPTLTDHRVRYAFSGTDAVIHISEEMPIPERQLPQAM